MTIYRAAGSVDDVLRQVIADLAPNTVRRLTGKSANNFYQISRPDNDRALSLVDAAALDAALVLAGKTPAFEPIYRALRDGLAEGKKASAEPLEKSVLRIGAELGDVARLAETAMEDGVLDVHERRKLAHEYQDIIDAATAARDAIEPPSADVESLEPKRSA